MWGAESEGAGEAAEGLPISPAADIEDRERKLKIGYRFQLSIINRQRRGR